MMICAIAGRHRNRDGKINKITIQIDAFRSDAAVIEVSPGKTSFALAKLLDRAAIKQVVQD